MLVALVTLATLHHVQLVVAAWLHDTADRGFVRIVSFFPLAVSVA